MTFMASCFLHDTEINEQERSLKSEVTCLGSSYSATKKIATGTSMDHKQLIGVNLISDSGSVGHSTYLGVIIESDIDLPNCSLCRLRELACSQIKQLPKDFCFCTKQGWSIDKNREGDLKLQSIISENGGIYIQRFYDKPKVGIKTKTGTVVGFVFVDYQATLHQLRQTIHQQLFGKDSVGQYWFLDANTWPVRTEQESRLTVIDILCGTCVMVDGNIASSSPLSGQLSSETTTENRKCLPVRGTRQLSFHTGKDIERDQPSESKVSAVQFTRQILISYVRAEAAPHALSLKQELSHLGFSVFLDVDEIRSGVDWQDSLNYAVSNCEVFVPLVTPRYGETQWTNREVKLADVLGKFILPINFLEEWPPKCLAIQFSTTQFITWKSPEQLQMENVKVSKDISKNIQVWDQKYVNNVAMEIRDRLKNTKLTGASALNKKFSMVKRRTVVKSCAMVEKSNEQALTTDREGCPLVVICLHQEQLPFGIQVRSFLQDKGYEVWLTTELSTRELSVQCDVKKDLETSQKQTFQEKADDAGVVIAVLTREFVESRCCQQQLYYCEQRKRIIPVKVGDFQTPCWLSMLIGNPCVEELNEKNYKDVLPRELSRNLDPIARVSPRAEINEARVSCAVKQLKKLLDTEKCVYITGGLSVADIKQECICSAIGSFLCNVDQITMVTGGFYGVDHVTGKAFFETAREKFKGHKVWHILPERDPTDWSREADQNKDGSFRIANFGQTFFCGESIQERDSIVSRAFDVCIIICGDRNSSQVAEKFTWNDRLVIPVQINEKEKANMPSKIFEIPQFVNRHNWSLLNDTKVTHDVIGRSVQDIICDILSQMQKETTSQDTDEESDDSPPRKMLKSALKTSPKSKKLSLSSMKTVLL